MVMAVSLNVTEEQLEDRYVEWRRQFNDEVYPSLNKDAKFSPSWEVLWKNTWRKYDNLEVLRKQRHLPQRSWQEMVEAYRQQVENWRRHISGPLLDSDWALCPLGLKIERITGVIVSRDCDRWDIALERFDQFRRLMGEQETFNSSLSTTQRVSWTLIEEWWDAKYQDRALSKAAISSLKAAASTPQRLKRFEDREEPGPERSAAGEKSIYHGTLFQLYVQEFDPASWEPHMKDISLLSLKILRRQALAYATAQRLGYVCYATLKASALPEQKSYIGSTQDPCEWLQKDKNDSALPYFLWDVVKLRTVLVADLAHSPSYCCVSHTWGRWRKEPSVDIDGVPWRVPQNQRFVVQELPSHLKRLQPQPQYIWIDLFCIPQDGSPKADEEINRQSSIFQNASRCVAWQNDVLEWSVTKWALSWLGLAFLNATSVSSLYETGNMLLAFREKVEKPGELFPEQSSLEIAPGSMDPAQASTAEKAYEEPASWFSSLWTLQEAMLCPDMILVGRHWTQLTDLMGTPVPFNTIFSVVDTMQGIWNKGIPYEPYPGKSTNYAHQLRFSSQFDPKQDRQWPRAAGQLANLALLTRMDNLFSTSSPTTLLSAANLRQCTGSRAPAIMSAVGVTDWYQDSTPGKQDSKLVLGCYPLAFVREAASKLGASFYTSISHRQKVPKPNQIYDLEYYGSMMPFSARVGWLANTSGVLAHIEHACQDHPSVESWKIDINGSVRIKRAGIFAASTNMNAAELWMTIYIMKNGSEACTCDFYSWVSQLPEGQCIYAVSLLRDSNYHHGLILQGYKKAWLVTQRLVRVGVYFTNNRDLPRSSRVDWVVI